MAPSPPRPPCAAVAALAIGGLDPGGGAGVLADLRAFAAAGAFGCAAVALTTVQSTGGLKSVRPLPARHVRAQAEEVMRNQAVKAIKIGALGSAEIVRSVGRLLAAYPRVPVVVDTPIRPTRGRASLLSKGALRAVVHDLLPRATLVTVNLDEARALLGVDVRTIAEARAAARLLGAMGPRAALVKGGHMDGPLSIDLLAVEGQVLELRAERLPLGPTHGTGCTFASLVAGRLAVRGFSPRGPRSDLVAAIRWAKRVHHEALTRTVSVGRGMNVMVF